MTESFAELFEQSLNTTQLNPGSIVTGTVVEITNDSVIGGGSVSVSIAAGAVTNYKLAVSY